MRWYLRRLVKGEAYPPNYDHSGRSPAKCGTCKHEDTEDRPLYRGYQPMRGDIVTCLPCVELGRPR